MCTVSTVKYNFLIGVSMNKCSFYFSALALFLATGNASADQGQESFDVGANVTGSCVIVSLPTISFGVYDSTGVNGATGNVNANLDVSSQLSVRCTRGSQTVRVSLDEGLYPAPGSTARDPVRQLRSGDNFLKYRISRDRSFYGEWGQGNGGWYTISDFTSSLIPRSVKVYARVIGRQSVPAGDYSDTVGMTLTF